MQKRFFAIILCAIIFGLFCLAAKNSSKAAFSSTNPTGYAIIKVLEDASMSPINNATICVVETRCYYQTNKYGYTEKIPVPVISNKNFDISLKRDYGEFTIIVYAPGYTTLVSYYNAVYSGMTNAGIVCKLQPIINAGDRQFTSSANKPSDDYTEKLITLYKK